MIEGDWTMHRVEIFLRKVLMPLGIFVRKWLHNPVNGIIIKGEEEVEMTAPHLEAELIWSLVVEVCTMFLMLIKMMEL
ncbi:hypothetical protein RchiOBHm_Chr5g0042701 [Rosa chinensis]|uniref:Uncharacterized protein n=1 Tax=Rosa chinensis TaxID=74649 RepID=A0A2P6QD44_ROSCH|nr:hypothetical protein RchiOBHm_Chr5g0042701 [Rosa chinensis]